ncbi:MAG TPA: hypothetical protein VFU16_08660 [Solirubrobacterales bacterium]|nr:hypothetical protein [Solirubrobacterales bacterium]
MCAENGRRKLVAVEMYRLTEIAEKLPDGSVPEGTELLGGFVRAEADETTSAADEAATSHCVTVVAKANKNHEVIAAEWCGGGNEWEIVSETVIGSI